MKPGTTLGSATQTRVGRSSIIVTLDRYGHLFPELGEAIGVGVGERACPHTCAPERRLMVRPAPSRLLAPIARTDHPQIAALDGRP